MPRIKTGAVLSLRLRWAKYGGYSDVAPCRDNLPKDERITQGWARGQEFLTGIPGTIGRTAAGVVILVAAAAILADCGESLPRSELETTSTWPTFEAAKAAYDEVKPSVTDVDALHRMGYDPYGGTNVQILSYLDVSRRFLAGDPQAVANVPPPVRTCLKAQNACKGYEVNLRRIHRKRKGSTFLDLFNFRRRTYETGWIFKALFVIHNNLVVYKLWSGIPKIDRRIRAENPLGPIQEPADVLKSRIP